MHLKVIACEVLAREILYCAASARNTADIELNPQGYHADPERCRRELQAQIDAVPAERYDALLLGYALCSNSLVGIRAGSIPMVIPRAHDCITFYLGSKERYWDEFYRHPGTYYYTSGWLEHPQRHRDRKAGDKQAEERQSSFDRLAAKYGEDNARYITEVLGHWKTVYTHGALIEFPFTAHLGLEERVREICRERGWEFMKLEGDLSLIRRWLDGEWAPEDFLVVQPGQGIYATHGPDILGAR